MHKNIFGPLFRSRKKYTALIAVLLAFSLLVSGVCLSLLLSLYQKRENYEHTHTDYVNSYKLTDNLTGAAEKKFLSQPDAVDKLKILYRQMNNHGDFAYAVYGHQPIYTSRQLDRKFLDGYGELPSEYLRENIYQSFQINAVGLASTTLKLKTGRLFRPEEYLYAPGKELPLIVGSEYEGVLALDEVLSMDYLGEIIRYRVVGILEKDSYIVSDNTPYFLDRCLVIPAIECTYAPADDHARSFQKKVCLDNINGTIYTDLNSLEALSIVQDLCDQAGIPHSSIMGVPSLNILGLAVKQALWLFLGVSLLLMVIAVFCCSANILSKTDLMMRTFAIHILCGATPGRLLGYLLLDNALVVGLSTLPAAVMLLFFKTGTALLLLLGLAALTFVCVSIPPAVRLRGIRVTQQIRRGSK